MMPCSNQCCEDTQSRMWGQSGGGCFLRESGQGSSFRMLRYEHRIEQSERTSPADLEKVGSMWKDWQMPRPWDRLGMVCVPGTLNGPG